MERTVAFWTIEMSAKLRNKEEGVKFANRFINKFSEICKLNKDYKAQVIIGVSNLNGKLIDSTHYENRKIKRIISTDKNKIKKYGKLEQKWHVHILALTHPSETFARHIKDYINKNWCVKAYINYKMIDMKADVKGTKKYIDTDMLLYIAKQSDTIRYYCNKDSNFDGLSFKNLYNEYLRVQTILNKRKYIFRIR